jgi:hypothetical protein
MWSFLLDAGILTPNLKYGIDIFLALWDSPWRPEDVGVFCVLRM